MKKLLTTRQFSEYSRVGENLFVSNFDVREFYSSEKVFFKVFPFNRMHIRVNQYRFLDKVFSAEVRLELDTKLYEKQFNSLFECFVDHVEYLCTCEPQREQVNRLIDTLGHFDSKTGDTKRLTKLLFDHLQSSFPVLKNNWFYQWPSILFESHTRINQAEYFAVSPGPVGEDIGKHRDQTIPTNKFGTKGVHNRLKKSIIGFFKRFKNAQNLTPKNAAFFEKLAFEMFNCDLYVELVDLFASKNIGLFDSKYVYVLKLIRETDLHEKFHFYAREKFKRAIIDFVSEEWITSESCKAQGNGITAIT